MLSEKTKDKLKDRVLPMLFWLYVFFVSLTVAAAALFYAFEILGPCLTAGLVY